MNKQSTRQDACVVVTDAGGEIRYASAGFAALTGYSAEQLGGRNISILRDPAMPPELFRELWTTLRAGSPWMGLVRNRDRAGGEFWVDTYIVPILENGELVECHGIYRPPADAIRRRAERVLQLRRQGRRPPQLRFPYPSLAWRAPATALLPLLPAAAAALVPQPLTTRLALLGVAAAVALAGSRLLVGRFVRQIGANRQLADSPVKRLIYTGSRSDSALLELVPMLLQSRLTAMLQHIWDTSATVRRGASASCRVMQETRGSVIEQQDALTRLATAMDEYASTTESVAQTTSGALDQVQSVQRDARSGAGVVALAGDGMEQLDQAMQQINRDAENLQRQSDGIDRVIDVIRDIAEQTNLLALNAAIEAARAGDSGRGFAVVADEVRQLAQRTQASTREINEMVAALQAETGRIATAAQHGRELSRHSVDTVRDVGESLAGILQAVDRLEDVATQIAAATEQQTAVSADINAQLHAINLAAQSMVTQAEQTLALNRDSEQLAERQSLMVERVLNV